MNTKTIIPEFFFLSFFIRLYGKKFPQKHSFPANKKNIHPKTMFSLRFFSLQDCIVRNPTFCFYLQTVESWVFFFTSSPTLVDCHVIIPRSASLKDPPARILETSNHICKNLIHLVLKFKVLRFSWHFKQIPSSRTRNHIISW